MTLDTIPDRGIKLSIYAPASYSLFHRSPGPIGGAEINLYLIARTLARRNSYAVNCLVDDYGQAKTEAVQGVTLIRLTSSRARGIAGFLSKRWRYLDFLLRDDSDVYLASSASEFLIYLVAISKFLKRKKVLFRVASENDLRDRLAPEYAASKFHRWCRKSPLSLIYRWTLTRVDAIIVQSKDQWSLMRPRLRAKSVLIRNMALPGPENPRFENKTVMLWVGKAVPLKRPEMFLELARRVPEQNFLMILQGQNAFAREIGIRTKTIPNLRLLGRISFDKIYRYFVRAKCLVNTSIQEGFPNTFIQAGLFGCPLLSFRVNPDDIISRYQLGWVCRDSLEVAADVLKNVLPLELRARGENCRKYVLENHDLTKNSRLYDDLIRRICLSK